MTDEHRALIERLVLIFVPAGAPATADELRHRLSDPATLSYTAFVPPIYQLQMRQVATEAATAADRERCAAIVEREREADGDPEQLRRLLAAIREGAQ